MVVSRWWFGDVWWFLGWEHGTKLKVGWIGICTNLFLKICCGPLYRSTIWIQIGWSFNMMMISSTRARLCKNGWHHNQSHSFNSMHNIQIWITLNTFGHFSNNAWTNLQHLQEVSKNYKIVCVQCILIAMQMIAWCFMRACHNELTLCWRVGVTGPITEDFVGNLNKIEYMYIVSFLIWLCNILSYY
jgi:hypothetical protein